MDKHEDLALDRRNRNGSRRVAASGRPFLHFSLGFVDAGDAATVVRVFLEFVHWDEPEEP